MPSLLADWAFCNTIVCDLLVSMLFIVEVGTQW